MDLSGGDGTQAKKEMTCKTKMEPHPDLVARLQDFRTFVYYDEGYNQRVEVNITGITNIADEAIIMTHTKGKKSGVASTNSGRITRESEGFTRTEELFKAWEALKTEAYKFIFENKRAQADLFAPEEDGEDVSDSKKEPEEMAVA
jgi:hypothetical protein